MNIQKSNDYQNIPHSKTIWGVYPNFRQTQMRTMIMRHLLEEPDLTPREACPHTGNKFPALRSIQHSSTWFNSVSFELRLCRHPGRLRHLWSCCSRLGPAIYIYIYASVSTFDQCPSSGTKLCSLLSFARGSLPSPFR